MKQCVNKQYTISVPKENSFALVMPLKRRTYVSNQPIDEDINASELEDVVLKVGGVEYTPELGDDGVRVIFPEGLPAGTYDIVLTAIYHGSKIMAAYFEALRSVDWNYMSDAQNYLPGSPIVAEAAYIIGGVLTDAELAQLKERYRQAAIAAEEAEAEAIAEKEKYAEAVQELDDLATEPNATQNKQAILDALDTAKAALQGTNDNATNTAILAAFDLLKAAIQGTDTTVTLTALLSAITAAKDEILAALPHEASAEFIQSLFASES